MELPSFLMDLGMEWNLIQDFAHVGLLTHWQDEGVQSHGELTTLILDKFTHQHPLTLPPMLLTSLCLTYMVRFPCVLSTARLPYQLQNSHLCPVYCLLDIPSQANSRLQSHFS